MADIAASVLARLKNRAKESGRSYQFCLQLFCQEEFLRRLEKIAICGKSCTERWLIHLFRYQF